MQKAINNYTKMFNTILAVLMSNQTIWNTILAMAAAVDSVKNTIGEITATGQTQSKSTKGITLSKKQIRKSLTAKLMTIMGGLRSFAIATGNDELLQNCSVTESELNMMNTTRFITTCQKMIDYALQYKVQLVDYNVIAAIITATVTESASYIAIVPKTAETIAIKKNATKQLNMLVKQGMSQVNVLDQFMLTFKSSNPEFYAQYKNARKITDIGVRHNKFTGKIVRGSVAVPNAELSIIGEDKSTVTVWSGDFEIDGVHTGGFSVEVKDGSTTKIINGLQMRRGTDLNMVIDLAA